MEAKMTGRLRLSLFLAIGVLGIASAISASGADIETVQCSLNDERVWVYDSLTSLNITAKLKCGDSVEILGHEKGYIKVRTANGKEGYVPKEVLPKAAIADDQGKTNDVPSLAQQARQAERSRARLVEARATATVTPTSGPAAITSSKQATDAAPAPAQRTVQLTLQAASQTQTHEAPVIAPNASAAPAVAKTAPAAPIATKTSIDIETVAVNQTGPAAPTVSSTSPPKATPPASTRIANAAPAAKQVQVKAPVATFKTSEPAEEIVPPPNAVASNVSARQSQTEEPAVTSLAANSVDMVPSKTADGSAEADDDSDDLLPENQAPRRACSVYFSAYGLTTTQYAWIVQDAAKRYPSVCPAPSPSLVDFVVIFTHGVGFYNYTMPDPVHVDGAGFSDWTALTTVDPAMARPGLEKSGHEYVWVFHMKRGAFDPGRFSSRRRPQFSKSEPKSQQSVADAFDFIGERGINR
jgi:hypothetical protein